jgi:hypothetical protein
MDLHRVYRFFFLYLLIVLAQIFITMSVPYSGAAYRTAWLVTEALVVCAYVLVVLELYSVILESLSGLASLSRRYIKIAVAAAAVVSLVLLVLEQTPSGSIGRFLIFERAIVSSLLIFVFLLSVFLVYYPIPLSRNAIVYSIGYAIYFLTKAAGFFVLNFSHDWYREFTRLFNTTLAAVSTCCLLLWLFTLNRRGEMKKIVIGHQWDKHDEARLLEQLKTINANLLRTARK